MVLVLLDCPKVSQPRGRGKGRHGRRRQKAGEPELANCTRSFSITIIAMMTTIGVKSIPGVAGMIRRMGA